MNPMIAVLGGLGAGVLIGLFVPMGFALVITVGFLIIALIMKQYATIAIMALLGMIGVTVVKVYMWNQTVGLNFG